MAELKFPTEVIELPSKGFFYPEGHPLKEGKIELKYMTAKEEDILSNNSYITEGIVMDKLLESMIVSPKFNHKDLLTGDKNAILIAARILGFGPKYQVQMRGKTEVIDLSTLDAKPLNVEGLTEGENKIEFVLPKSNNKVTFKLLNGHDEDTIDKELESLKKITQNPGEISTRLKHLIVAVEDKTDDASIREFVDNYLLAMDSRALRDHYKKVMPDVDMSLRGEDGRFRNIPIGLSFFWPELEDSI